MACLRTQLMEEQRESSTRNEPSIPTHESGRRWSGSGSGAEKGTGVNGIKLSVNSEPYCVCDSFFRNNS